MLPTSTTNATPDAQRRRISARRSRSRSSGPDDVPVNTLIAVLDSPSDRVAARKRRLIHSGSQAQQQQQQQQQEDQGSHTDGDDPILNMRIPQSASEDTGASRITTTKSLDNKTRKKLNATDSSRSLDRAADLLEQERIQRLQSSQSRQPQRSHRQSLPSTASAASAAPAATGTDSSSSRSQRSALSGLPDIKSMLKHILPSSSKKQQQQQLDDSRIRSASERNTRSSHRLQQQQARQRTVQSEHCRRRGSDTELLVAGYGSTSRRRSIPLSDADGTTAATASSSSAGAGDRGGGGGGATLSTSSPSLLKSLWRGSSSTKGTTTATTTTTSSTSTSTSQKSVLSPRLLRKAKREELIEELSPSLRDSSSRVRDSSTSRGNKSNDNLDESNRSSGGGSRGGQKPKALPMKKPVAVASDQASSSSSAKQPKAQAQAQEKKKPSTSISSTASPLDEVRASSSLVEGVEGVPPPARQKSKRSLSVPSSREKGMKESSKKPQARGVETTIEIISDQHSSVDVKPSSTSSKSQTSRRKIEDKGSTSTASKRSDRASREGSAASKTKSQQRGGSEPPPPTETVQKVQNRRRSSSSHGFSSSSDHTQEVRRSSRSSTKAPPKMRDKLISSGGSKARRKSHSSSNVLESTKSSRSSSSKKLKSKREQKEGKSSASSKSPKAPRKKEALEDKSESSITVDDLAVLGDSLTSLGDDSKTPDSDSKAKRKKKTKKESSSSSRLHSSSRSSKSPRSESRSISRSWQSAPSGMNLSDSFEDLDSTDDRSKTEGSSGALGKSPKKSPKEKGRKKTAKDEPTSVATTTADSTNPKTRTPPKAAESAAKVSDTPTPGNDDKSKKDASREKRPQKSPKSKDRKKATKDETTVAKAIKTGGNDDHREQAKGGESVESDKKRGSQADETREGTVASKDDKKTSISSYLSSNSKATDTENASVESNDDNLSQMPPLSDVLSVDLSIDSYRTEDSSQSSKSMPLDTGLKRGKESQSKTKEDDQVSSLDAILEMLSTDSDPKVLLEGPGKGASHGEIFQDSPTRVSPLSPLINSLPMLFEPQEAVIERLASSMPNLNYHHTTTESPGDSPKTKPARKARVDNEGIFQDDSDDSPNSRDSESPNPERVDVMSEIAGQIEERHEEKKQPLQPRPSRESFRATLISEIRLSSPARDSAATTTVSSPRLAESKTTPGKQDRGPRKPQRRRDSFEEEEEEAGRSVPESPPPQSPPPLEHLSPDVASGQLSQDVEQIAKIMDDTMEWEDISESTSPSQEGGDELPLAYSSANMEFHRTEGRGWVQTPSNSSNQLERARQLSPVQELHETSASRGSSSARSERTTGGWNLGTIDRPSGPRRRASMSDLRGLRTVVSGERWSSSATSTRKGDAPPSFLRQSKDGRSSPAIGSSTSRDGDDLTRLFSLPRGAVGGQDMVARTYLPISLQSTGTSTTPSKGRKKATSATRRRRSSGDNNLGIADMFQMMGQLEEDLIDIQNQANFLRAQREQLMQQESNTNEPAEEEAESESEPKSDDGDT